MRKRAHIGLLRVQIGRVSCVDGAYNVTIAVGGEEVVAAAIVAMVLTCVTIRTRHGNTVVGASGVLVGEPFLDVVVVADAVGAGFTGVVSVLRRGVGTVLSEKKGYNISRFKWQERD